MSRDLLPLNRTPLESALADVVTLETEPSVLKSLWDADECPTTWLPWLAWALSVEGWESAITEAQQRALIRQSVQTHARKGTPSGVKDALRAIGIEATIEERGVGLAPYAFNLRIDLHDRGVDALTQDKIEALIEEYKNKRSYLNQLALTLVNQSAVPVIASVVVSGEITMVYPLLVTALSQVSLLYAGVGICSVETTTIYPKN